MRCLQIIIITVTCLSAAELTIDPGVEDFINSLNAEKKLSYDNQAKVSSISEGIRSNGGNLNIGYAVVRQRKDDDMLDRLSNLVADGQGEVGLMRFDEMNGRYLFRRGSYTEMPYTAETIPDELAEKARNDLSRLLGSEAEQFILANTETNWQQSGDDSEKKIVAYSYRFTRRINGRHIVDNTAYVRITYSGNDSLYGFDIVNPELRPVRIPELVRQDATRGRLERFASQKKIASNNTDGDVMVNRIIVEKGIPSYRAYKNDGQVIISPCISFFCKFDMENGRTFSRFKHFSLDASKCQNLEKSMIETRR